MSVRYIIHVKYEFIRPLAHPPPSQKTLKERKVVKLSDRVNAI
jgi:hypothetical protein